MLQRTSLQDYKECKDIQPSDLKNEQESTRLPIKEVLEKLDKDFPDDLCPLSLSLPLIPFKANNFGPNSRFSNHSFELSELLKHIIVYHKNLHPFTHKKLTINDIGTEIIPDEKLISRVDEKLKEYKYSREELLKFYGISPTLYQFLLKFNPNQYYKQRDSFYDYLNDKRLYLQVLYLILVPSFVCSDFVEVTAQSKALYYEITRFFIKYLNNPATLVGHIRDKRILMESSQALPYLCDALSGKTNDPNYSAKETLTFFQNVFFKNDLTKCMLLGKSREGENIQYFARNQFPDSLTFTTGLIWLAPLLTSNLIDYALFKQINKKSKFILFTFALGSAAISFDAITGSLCFLNRLSISNSILEPSACAQACNDISNYSQSGIYTTNLGNNTHYLQNMCHWTLDKTTAAITNIVVPIALTLFGRCLKKRIAKNEEFEELATQSFDYLHRKK